ncbi:hypothetical protein CORT_0G02830 [Candida orthopsilosis Co 90-125]|uniref:Uncharacterized protein n=1 Tax=Candida orthopsilosis (strain 90-125) TaxID=1136231 RepID=H8X9Y5_CANO9|nr:hypothetical protein CORT_0G02830 [Candida orthopsilosis Co 90-125]CCG24962.1 hypothetical protein CORT_0G02830 [Candida orthopsilosis Co 90-125]
MGTNHLAGVLELIKGIDLPLNTSTSTIKLYLCQCVTLLFLFRFSTPKNSSRINQLTNLAILFEIILCIITNAASYFIVSTESSQYFTIDLKFAIAIQVIIIYGLFVTDLLVAFISSTNRSDKQQQEKEEEVYVSLHQNPEWLGYLCHLNNDFLKIILSYNFIMINDLEVNTTLKMVEFGIKLYCLCIMLRYEFKKEDEQHEMVSDVGEKV